MKAVVDTNVVAYYLLGTPKFLEEVRAFWIQAGELLAPALWEAEIANVIWMAARSGVVAQDDAPAKLRAAYRLRIDSVGHRSLGYGALVKSLHSGLAAYDALFVELAERERLPLVTFDEKVIKAYPAIARRPRDVRI